MNVDSVPLASIPGLNATQKAKLLSAGVKSVKDLLLPPPFELARRLKLPLDDLYEIVDIVCRQVEEEPRPLNEVAAATGVFTCGDSLLDTALGGGIRTGMIWEFCGEGSAGKTQLALQLALMVQLPKSLGGLSGSCCYITTTTPLATSRLRQLIQEHTLLLGQHASLANIHTVHAPEVGQLINILTYTILGLLQQQESYPIKLLVLDSIFSLFHGTGKTTTASLVKRAKRLTEISSCLRTIANKYNVAIVVINGVADVFSEPAEDNTNELKYSHQFQFIARADTIPGEDRKEATLGLVWTNQIHSRVILTRTNRRKRIESENSTEPANKRRKFSSSNPADTYEDIHEDLDNTTALRRLSIIFCPVAPLMSLDYIITSRGIQGVELDDSYLRRPTQSTSKSVPQQIHPPNLVPLADIGASLDGEQDEEDAMWKEFGELDDEELEEAEKLERGTVLPQNDDQEDQEDGWPKPPSSQFVRGDELDKS